MSSILFVINHKAGKDRTTDYETSITNYFKDTPTAVHFFDFPGKQAKKLFQEKVAELDPDTVVAVGGDGTVTFVASELLDKKCSMGIIPAGSANGMARELDIPESINGALDIITNASVKKTDVIAIKERGICLHVSDAGLNAQLVKYFHEGNIRGKIGYARALIKALIFKRRMIVSVQTKNKEVIRSAIMVAIANATKYGTGAVINPTGNIYDGLFEVIIVRKLGIFSILKMFLKFTRFNPKKIEVLQARKITITGQAPMHFQTDGEYLGKVRTIEAEILPGKLNLIVP
jgi:YegS/Rv2252/BmrU family lipid kinase